MNTFSRKRGAISGLWIGAGAVLLVIVLLIAAKFAGGGPVTFSDAVGVETAWYIGPEKAPATLTEYGDFQCPACAAYYKLVKDLEVAYPTTLRVQFKHFPLTQIHKNARYSARAAEAAGKQGKFWEMHNQLYDHQAEWSDSPNPTAFFVAYAKAAGLDVAIFEKDLADNTLDAAVNADQKAGTTLALQGTPSFFINGVRIQDNPRTVDDFKKLIDEAIRNSKGLK